MFLNDATLRNLSGTLFGYDLSDTISQPTNFRGMSGWFTVPGNWNVRDTGFGNVQASPNEDFSRPVYYCETNDDGRLVFQDLRRTIPNRS